MTIEVFMKRAALSFFFALFYNLRQASLSKLRKPFATGVICT